jgi:tripartite-type tricarboxylate transporter receptor subunit TctC
MHFPRRRQFFAGTAAAALALALGAPAQAAEEYPSRPITMIVPLQAGTLADLVARSLGDELAAILRQPVVVDNRPSASQVVASSVLARSAPNGYTLMVSAMPNVIAPGVLKSQNFAGNADFTAIASILSISPVLAVSPSLPVSNLREFIALLKANPGKYMFGSAGVGTPMHMYLEMFNRQAGTQSVHVPYKTLQQIIPDVSSGTVQYSFLPFSTVQLAQSGKMKLLGVAAAKRDPAHPDIPTLDEQGLKGFEGPIHYLVVAPKGTPAPIVDKLNAAINTVLARDTFAGRFKSYGGVSIAKPDTPAHAAQVLKREDERFTALVREGKIPLE